MALWMIPNSLVTSKWFAWNLSFVAFNQPSETHLPRTTFFIYNLHPSQMILKQYSPIMIDDINIISYSKKHGLPWFKTHSVINAIRT